MPLPIAHGLFGAGLVAAIHPEPFSSRYFAPLFIGAFLANLADFDFLLVFATHSKEWHRGFSHSIIFALFIGFLFMFYFSRRRLRESLAYSLAYASHFVLDYLTTKNGGGLELFFPFSPERFGLRWFGLSEAPSKMSFREILQTLVLEFAVFFSLLLLIIFLRRTMFKHKAI